jgi:N utilization substance protein B
MQSLFAYDQCKEANYNIALEQIETRFQPNLNSMEVQNKDLLKEQRRAARILFEKKFNSADAPGGADATVNEAVSEALIAHQKQTKKDLQALGKSMAAAVERINDFYYSVLGLIVALADQAASDKKSDFKNLATNPLILGLKKNSDLTKHLMKSNVGWENRADKIRSWFVEFIRPDAELKKLVNTSEPTADDNKVTIKYLSRKLILGKSPMNSHFEEEDIYWTEDHEIVRSLVDKTIKSLKADTGAVELQRLSLDWEDDREFMSILFSGASNLDDRFKKLIANNTKNWEVDRLPLTDRVILEMAITELISFQHIPVKVTINEYIELAKLYSTPKSRQFINGILDVIAKELVQSGDIKKSGRGLIDNK